VWHGKCIILNEGYVYIYCWGWGGGGAVFRGVKGKEKNEVKEGKGRVGYI